MDWFAIYDTHYTPPEKTDIEEIYETNKEFQEYIERYRRKNNKPLKELFQEQIIKNIAYYYRDK